MLQTAEVERVVDLIQTQAPDLALLARCQGNVETHELCNEIRQLDAGRNMALMVIDGEEDTEHAAMRALLSGADDYVARPQRLMELRARIRVQLRHCRDRALLQLARRERRRLKSAAMTDPLTEVLNRRGGDEALRLTMHDPESLPVLVLLADIDHFKRVNDNFGHPAGDQVIRHVAHRLSRMLRHGDHVARYGGEEFLLIVRCVHAGLSETVADRFRSGVERSAVEGLPEVGTVTISVGGATWNGGGSRPAVESLVQLADEALYVSKGRGRNRVTIRHWDRVQTSASASPHRRSSASPASDGMQREALRTDPCTDRAPSCLCPDQDAELSHVVQTRGVSPTEPGGIHDPKCLERG